MQNAINETVLNIFNAGFNPLYPFSDLRSRGEDIVLVDFGEDLGHFSSNRVLEEKKVQTFAENQIKYLN